MSGAICPFVTSLFPLATDLGCNFDIVLNAYQEIIWVLNAVDVTLTRLPLDRQVIS